MVKKGTEVKQPTTWTIAEKNLAEDILNESKKYSGTFLERYSAAAGAFGYASYASLPPGTKAFISSLGGKHTRKKKTLSIPDTTATGGRPESPIETWYKDASTSKSIQHALHPEDESDIIDYFQKK